MKRGVTKPTKSQGMMVRIPGKPKAVYNPSAESLKIARDKQRIERMREQRDLEDATKEVWE